MIQIYTYVYKLVRSVTLLIIKSISMNKRVEEEEKHVSILSKF